MKVNSRSGKKTGQAGDGYTSRLRPILRVSTSFPGLLSSALRANGTYHIFCFWEDARPDRITRNPSIDNVARDNQSAVIVLYLDALTETERHDIRRESWANDLTFSIVDDVLLAYLTRIHRGTALGTALEEGRGCSSESGIMVLEQKPARKEHPIDAATEQSRPHPHRL